jgi:hypothetical protein
MVVALDLEYFVLKGRKLLYVATEMLNVAETKPPRPCSFSFITANK